jgi:hypothetical protein
MEQCCLILVSTKNAKCRAILGLSWGYFGRFGSLLLPSHRLNNRGRKISRWVLSAAVDMKLRWVEIKYNELSGSIDFATFLCHSPQACRIDHEICCSICRYYGMRRRLRLLVHLSIIGSDRCALVYLGYAI